MLEIIALVHYFLIILSMLIFSPLNHGVTKEYKKLFVRSLPFLSLLSVFIPVFIIAYILLCPSMNYIDSFNTNKKIYIFICIYTIIIFLSLLGIVWKELSNASDDLKDSRPFFIPSIYLFLYSSSVILSGTFIDISNRFLDFSKPEEHIVEVTKCYSLPSDRSPENSSFIDISLGLNFLKIKPEIYRQENIAVSAKIYCDLYYKLKKKAEEDEKNNKFNPNGIVHKTLFEMFKTNYEIKVKAFVYKGLYGIRYIGKSVEILKN